MNLNRQAIILELISKLASARHGEKEALKAAAATQLQCSKKTIENELTKARAKPERKQRSDSGKSVYTIAQLHKIGSVWHASGTQRGLRMPLEDIINILCANGELPSALHESTVSRQLTRIGYHAKQLALPTPSVQVASKGPNTVCQADSTTGIYYYMPGGKLRFMPEDETYKNKLPELAKKVSDLVTRYTYVDVASHAAKSRHYLGGESARNLLDFLTWCMVQQDGNPMHGVPTILVMDPGSANKSMPVKNFCNSVGVKLINHAPGNARATGSVEKFHDLIGMRFERRLRFQDPAKVTLDALNEQLQEWLVYYCGTRIHTRHGLTRFDAWMRIKPEHLRVPASLELLRAVANRDPELRRVSNDKTVSFEGRTYEVADVPGAQAGMKVSVRVNVFRHPAIDVACVDPSTGAQSWQCVPPVQLDDFGYRVGAPVWGEDIRTAKLGPIDHARNDALRLAYTVDGVEPTLKEATRRHKKHAQAFPGIDVFADVKAAKLPDYMPRRSVPLSLGAEPLLPAVLNVVQACKRLKEELGGDYSPEVYSWVSAKFPQGVPEDQLRAIAQQFAPTAPRAVSAASGLKAVGGE